MARIRKTNPGETAPRGTEPYCPNPQYVVEGFSMLDIYARMKEENPDRPANFLTWGEICSENFKGKHAFCHISGTCHFEDYQDALLFLMAWC